jgi:nitroimidazol reductase NimA-like FMN-containing flavoprotein (pyridoxamine 5'-phosphate oxidase superfamily)
MTRIASGPWDEVGIIEFLDRTVIPIRLATNGSSGPLVQSLWFAPRALELWCCTQKTSLLTKRLERDDRVGFEVAADTPPYRGVRGTGVAHLSDKDVEATLRTLIERYQGTERTELSNWLLSRVDSEVAIRIEPRTITSWDFSHRMIKPRTGDQ